MLIIKPTRCTNFLDLLLEWNSTCSGQLLCPSSGVFHCTLSNGICHTSLLTACEQDQDGTAVPSWSCTQAVSKTVWHMPLLCVHWKIPDDGQRNCPKHVEFHSENKFEKSMHIIGFIISMHTTTFSYINYGQVTVTVPSLIPMTQGPMNLWNPWISNLKGDCSKQYSVAWSAAAELHELCCDSAMRV